MGNIILKWRKYINLYLHKVRVTFMTFFQGHWVFFKTKNVYFVWNKKASSDRTSFWAFLGYGNDDSFKWSRSHDQNGCCPFLHISPDISIQSCLGHNFLTVRPIVMKLHKWLYVIEVMCREQREQLLHFWFFSYLLLAKEWCLSL